MADGDDNEGKRTAADRKVRPVAPADAAAPDGSAGPEVAGGSEASGHRSAPDAATTRQRRKTPFWRKGPFWVGLIAVEVALALVISFAFERSPTEVDLGGGDLAAFCAQVRTLQAEVEGAGPDDPADAVQDPSRFIRERDNYQALLPTAPSDLVADLERLIEVDNEMIATVESIGERKAADPTYSGLGALNDQLERAAARSEVAASRVDIVLRDGCGITDPGAVGPTTTVASLAPPGSTPR